MLLLRPTLSADRGPADPPATPGPDVADAPPFRWIGTLYFFSGFVALGLEVVWLRFLGIVNSNSTATFTVTLSVYLLGMGLGSLLVYPLLKRKMSARTIFSLAHAGTALAALATFGVLYRAAPINNEFIFERARDGTLSMGDIYWTEAALTATLMLLPTLCMGLVYPSVCDSFSGAASHRDRWVGQAYFIGTLGSVLGTLLIALVLIPRLGLHGAFALLVGISAVLCVVAWAAGGTMRDWRGWGLATAGLGLCVWAAVLAHDPAPVLRLTIAVQRAGRNWTSPAVLQAGPSPTSCTSRRARPQPSWSNARRGAVTTSSLSTINWLRRRTSKPRSMH
jgi:hypothetical protein